MDRITWTLGTLGLRIHCSCECKDVRRIGPVRTSEETGDRKTQDTGHRVAWTWLPRDLEFCCDWRNVELWNSSLSQRPIIRPKRNWSGRVWRPTAFWSTSGMRRPRSVWAMARPSAASKSRCRKTRPRAPALCSNPKTRPSREVAAFAQAPATALARR